MRERSNAEKLLMLLVGVCAVLLIIDTSINLIAKYAAGQALSELQTRLGNSQTNPTSSAGARTPGNHCSPRTARLSPWHAQRRLSRSVL